ncbi:hypothetical protein Bhyg_02373 [Pseudolycoriella hygida]|uniref:Uncharacterized protein n=1 Tax=Pseudolycoriella hygida TaxID=35572 RepID=A0A9Q0S7P7_9DIPT|nr:hypothetical protein Bhyg_02373 [Pseudolycoriella hygida]
MAVLVLVKMNSRRHIPLEDEANELLSVIEMFKKLLNVNDPLRHNNDKLRNIGSERFEKKIITFSAWKYLLSPYELDQQFEFNYTSLHKFLSSSMSINKLVVN